MIRVAKLFAFVFVAGGAIASAQGQDATNFMSLTYKSPPPEVNPVAHVREARSWEYGPFINYGTGVGNRSGYKFLWGGFQLSKPLSPVVHTRFVSGQFEFGGNVMPLWQAYTPAPYYQKYQCINGPCELLMGGGTYRGVSLTPVILRWNFFTNSRRFQPWFQGAGGLIYTTHKFPPNYQSTQIINGQTEMLDGGTSVWNFSPQGGFGVHIFTAAKRSWDVGVNGVHISSASLGDRNPGVNASVQVQVGYTFWK
ncbi:MAG: acyloxyacyl hydrolase [Terracidiphilus sp.]